MEELVELSEQKIMRAPVDFTRSIMDKINWKARLIGIKGKGARGVGKTTLLLQFINLHLGSDPGKVRYVRLDNCWFSNHSLVSLENTLLK